MVPFLSVEKALDGIAEVRVLPNGVLYTCSAHSRPASNLYNSLESYESARAGLQVSIYGRMLRSFPDLWSQVNAADAMQTLLARESLSSYLFHA
jgi:hypothetical protein